MARIEEIRPGIIGGLKLFFRGRVYVKGEPDNMPMLSRCRWCGQQWVIDVCFPSHKFLLIKTSGLAWRDAGASVEVDRYLCERYPEEMKRFSKIKKSANRPGLSDDA